MYNLFKQDYESTFIILVVTIVRYLSIFIIGYYTHLITNMFLWNNVN